MTNIEIEEEIKNIVNYCQNNSVSILSNNKKYIKIALKYLNSFIDWKGILYFSMESRGPTGEFSEECIIDFECSLMQVIFGIWKPAIISLRNCLENSCLLIYFFIQNNLKEYDKYFHGKEKDLFFKNDILKVIFENEPFKTYEIEYPIRDRIYTVYKDLCKYSHTKGWEHFECFFRLSNEDRKNQIRDGKEENIFLSRWIKHIKEVYQAVSVLFALASIYFCEVAKGKIYPVSDTLKEIISNMDPKDIDNLKTFSSKYIQLIRNCYKKST